MATRSWTGAFGTNLSLKLRRVGSGPPLSWDELPNGSAVSLRFPLAQSNRVRPIDDLGQSRVNSTVSTFEWATVDGPDVICSYAVYLMRCLEVALPFGSRSAVIALLGVPGFCMDFGKSFYSSVTCYFDDFVSFSTPSMCNNTQSTLCSMLDILGWQVDRAGPKCDDFSKSVSALGALFDLSETGVGTLKVRNTDKRVEDTTLF